MNAIDPNCPIVVPDRLIKVPSHLARVASVAEKSRVVRVELHFDPVITDQKVILGYDRLWHFSDMPARPLHVRYWGYFRRQMLAVSISQIAE